MSKSRVNILFRATQAHLIFRCHNRQFLFEPVFIKDQILKLWKKYKKKYSIKIFDFIIMDNHAHLLAQFKSQKDVSEFMRTVNSQIARIVNDYFERDSQVIRERFRSPVIRSRKYFRNVIVYIWKNCFQRNGVSDPAEYPYCSLNMRMKQNTDEFLDSYRDAGFHIGPSFRSFAHNILKNLRFTFLDSKIYENTHLVDDNVKIRENQKYFKRLYSMYINSSS